MEASIDYKGFVTSCPGDSCFYINLRKLSLKNKYGNSSTSGIGEALSDVLSAGNVNHKRKEELRKAEFLRIGQVIKFKNNKGLTIKWMFYFLNKEIKTANNY